MGRRDTWITQLGNSVMGQCTDRVSPEVSPEVRRGVRRGDGVEFLSIQDATRESSCDPLSIAATCQRDRYKTVGGYGWGYIDNPKDPT